VTTILTRHFFCNHHRRKAYESGQKRPSKATLVVSNEAGDNIFKDDSDHDEEPNTELPPWQADCGHIQSCGTPAICQKKRQVTQQCREKLELTNPSKH